MAISHCYWHLIFQVNLGMWPLKSIILEKWAPFLRVSTHIYGVSKDIDEKIFVFRGNLVKWSPQIICLGKMSPVLRDSTHIYGISKKLDGKPRHVTPEIDCLRNMNPVPRVSTHIYGVYKEIDRKTFIFRVNPGMWPLKLIVSEKHEPYFQGFQCTFMGYLMK